jgi:cell wall-associated NlpC family hydrolase
MRRVAPSELDETLQPGDFLFRYVDPNDPLDAQVTNAIIQSGQITVQASADAAEGIDLTVRGVLGEDQSRFERAFSRGEPNAVHVAIYLGGGETAEAFGTSLDDARVARWGDHARERALAFANAFDREGGPPDVGSMFCSQFAVAVLQSASARLYLPDEGRVWSEPTFDALPRESRVDAVASPLHVFGEWVQSGAFKLVAHVIVG